MDIFMLLSFVLGLALFLYGMDTMGNGLETASGGKLEKILEKLTKNRLMAILLGAGVTAAVQSSSATSVMVVGFVNSGIMKLKQAIGIIMGANIGTTITAWILSLAGIEGDNFLIKMLKPTSFSPILAAVGIVLFMFSKDEKKKNIGKILLGFAILMFGMDAMSGAVKPLAEIPEFGSVLLLFTNPVFGVLAGALITAIIQSSSASVGILQALCMTGAVSYGAAIPIIMGQNIGTCITAVLSAIGTKKNAKRAAAVHLSFNIIGTLLFLIVFYSLNALFKFSILDNMANPAGIAVVHSVFNISATIVLAPFAGLLEKLAYKIVKDSKEEKEVYSEFQVLDPRFLETPSYAIEVSKTLSGKMAEISREALLKSITLFEKYDYNLEKELIEMETKVDQYEDALGTYLVNISSRNLTNKDSKSVSLLLHSIGDLERISDHSLNIMQAAKEMHEKNINFSKEAIEELDVFKKAIKDILNTAIDVFISQDIDKAKTVEPLEEVIDYLNTEIKSRHVSRLTDGRCTIELGFVLSDIITNLERVSDHCSNLAVYVIQMNLDAMDVHEYMEKLKHEDNQEFKEDYKAMKKLYQLPGKVS